jgi:hypothetical protein
MYNSNTSKISESGLRYASKENGSPFQGMGSSGEIRSCLKCGQHKLRSKGAIHRYLSTLMFICFDCKPAKSN